MSDNASAPAGKQETPSIPMSITLGGQTYLVSETPELKGLISTVASIERAKLYSTINELKSGMEELKKVTVLPVAQTPAPVASTVPGTELNEFKDALLASVRDIIRSEVTPLQDFVNKQNTESLDSYRARLIEANKTTCIPELVKGTTKEELDSSLAESVRLRSQYSPVDFSKPGGQENPHQHVPAEVVNAANIAQQPNAVIPAPAVTILAPMGVSAIEDAPTDIAALSHEDFGKRRGELEAKMKSLVS